MKTIFSSLRRAIAIAAAITLISSAAWAASDTWITTKAKMSLLTTEGIHSNEVNVDTVDGEVTLHGSVASAAEKTKAQDVVQKIDGVRRVRNLLQVVADAKRDAVEAKDTDIKTNVENAFKNDPQLKDSSVKVQSVNAGVVLLAGDAKTLSQHLRAIEVASHVGGVKRVASEIKSPDRLADAEIYSEPARPAAGKDEGRTQGATGAVSDAWITSDVKFRLLADSRTPGLGVNVDTADGKVTLFGTVASAEAKAAAEENARKVNGVKGVDNALQIVPESKQDAVAAKDSDIQSRVKDQIARADQLKDASISVEVQNGVARLTGTVPSHEDRLIAAVTAHNAPGVKAVKDDLTVRP
jgi:hyperosmotically inducible protein